MRIDRPGRTRRIAKTTTKITVNGQHAHVIAGTVVEPLAFLRVNRTRGKKMPLLFYFPLIIWMGMIGVVQDELRVAVKNPARRAQRS